MLIFRSLPIFALFFLVGCWDGAYLDRGNQRHRFEPVKLPRDLPAAHTETASRVYTVGQQILAKNPDLPIRPVFTAIGSEEETVFHAGLSNIVISEGLVKRCESEEQLAAILCHELGKMASERELEIAQKERGYDEDPLLSPRMPDIAGSSMAPDMTQQAELAKFQKDRPRQKANIKRQAPDPKVLARTYLTKAGYNIEELDRVQPLLRNAERNTRFESQMKPPKHLDLPKPIPEKPPEEAPPVKK